MLTRSHVGSNLFAQVGKINGDGADTRLSEGFEMPLNQGLTTNLDHRLGNGIGEWSHPFAPPRGQDHDMHRFDFWC